RRRPRCADPLRADVPHGTGAPRAARRRPRRHRPRALGARLLVARVQRPASGDVRRRPGALVRAVVYTGRGGRGGRRFGQPPDPLPGTDELLVAASFAGVNTADLAQRAGAYPAPPGAPQDVPGLETAGVVVATGSAVRSVATGDRVFGLVGGGGLADRVV